MIQDLHVKSFGSLGDLAANLSHSNNPQSRASDFKSQHVWVIEIGGVGVHSYLVTYGKTGHFLRKPS